MTSPIDINPDHLDVVRNILHEHLPPDVRVRVFGSRASWTANDASDLDLALDVSSVLNHGIIMALKTAFEESSLPYKVDIIELNKVSDSFRQIVSAQSVLLSDVDKPKSLVGEWSSQQFGDCADLVHDTVSPIGLADIPYIGLEHLGEGTLSITGRGNASDVSSMKGRFRRGDILFGKLRPYFCKIARVDFDGICSKDIWVVRPTKETDANFLFYLMASKAFVEVATRGSDGTKMPRARWEWVSQYKVFIPPLDEQRAISNILKTMDDKIDANRQMNQTLKEMAQALFKSWFVDFDPVRAKTDGRWHPGKSLPGLPAYLYELFPDSLADSELGKIPRGWQVKVLGDLLQLHHGKPLQAKDRRSGTVPVYGSKGQIGSHDEILVSGPGIVVGRKGSPGTVTWVQNDFFPIDTAFYVVPTSADLNLPFLFYALNDQELSSVAADSAVPGLNRNIAHMNKQVMPTKDIADEFASHIRTLLKRRDCLNDESLSLAAQRDALLPKLVSGEIRMSTKSNV